ncbi:siderophore-interacting protein [Nocardiopsis ansamitocini]|uniref:Siderophore-interacting protein n=1 Tax=Nocardiopsis ansamitocini TaxID=1670832 RepID=A0A9W6P840_9ACTN|nr:siderophore-interacting protein [Nocardiopsis ansamitocini]GLU48915.1 siderophore-interacting protein [Nocardiopsis ansamitocini]
MTATRSAGRVEFYPLKPRALEVAAVRRITPRMIQVVLVGDDLAGFRTDNHADHVKLFFPEEGTGRHVMPVMVEDERWNIRAEGIVFRDYTVRRYDARAGELVVDFVAHEHGPAGRWAAQARPGQVLGVLGPRGTRFPPTGFDYHLVAADETALPAALRLIEGLAPDAVVHAFLEVVDAAEEQEVAAPRGARITWVHRGDAEPGTTDVLERALRAWRPPEGSGFAWAAGEADSLKPIRGLLKEYGFVRGESAETDGYWRRGAVNLDHHA